MEKYISNSEEETIIIATKILKKYDQEDIFFLIGDLGVGKTVFAKGFAKHLKIKDKITSPSFGIKNQYKNFTHYDLYFSKEKLNIINAIDEDAETGKVLIEWADKLNKKNLKNGVKINIKKIDENKRMIEVYI